MAARYAINFNKHGEGWIVNEEAGETLGARKLVYRNAFGTWSLADADAVATMPVLGITMGAISFGRKGWILLWGYIGTQPDPLATPYWNWTVGVPLYASTVAGELTETTPSGAGDVVQVVAIVVESTLIQFVGTAGAHSEPWDRVTEASYIVFKDGATYNVKNGVTGQIDFTGTITVIQDTIDTLEAADIGGTIAFKEADSTYDLGVTGLTIEKSGIRLIGKSLGKRGGNPLGVHFLYGGTGDAITIGDGVTAVRNVEVRNMVIQTFHAANEADSGIRLQAATLCTVDNVKFLTNKGFAIIVDALDLEAYFNLFHNVITENSLNGYQFDGGTIDPNANVIAYGRIQGQGTGVGIGIEVIKGDTLYVHGTGITNIGTAVDSSDNAGNYIRVRIEDVGTGYNFSDVDNNVIGGSIITVAVTEVVDSGDRNLFTDVLGYRVSKTKWFGVKDPDTNIGTHPAVLLGDGADITVYDQILIPSDFSELTDISVVVVPAGTGNMRRTVATNWGEIGVDDYNTSSDAIAAGQVAVTTDKLEAINIAAGVTGVVADDLIGITFIREGSDVNDTVNADCYYLGIRLRYIG